jgi:hypothetical protein
MAEVACIIQKVESEKSRAKRSFQPDRFGIEKVPEV